jgi:hypothetical protein
MAALYNRRVLHQKARYKERVPFHVLLFLSVDEGPVFNDLPQLDHCRLIVSKVNLGPDAICMLNDSFDRRFFDTPAGQFHLDVLARLELFGGHSCGSLPRAEISLCQLL